MQVPGDWNVQVHCARGPDGHRCPGHVCSHSGSRCPRAAVFCLSPILRSFPRVTGLSAPRTRGRIGTNMVEKKPLTEASAPGVCVCSHPQLFAGYQGFQNVLICSGHSPVTQSLSKSLWVHGVKLPPFPGLLGRVHSQGPATLAPSLWQPCVGGVGMFTYRPERTLSLRSPRSASGFSDTVSNTSLFPQTQRSGGLLGESQAAGEDGRGQ